MLGAGVIGLGVGKVRCLGYEGSEHVELKTVCDPMDERLQSARNHFDGDRC